MKRFISPCIDNTLRVLIVSRRLDIGGTEMHVTRIIPELRQLGIDVSLFVLERGGRLERELAARGVSIFGPDTGVLPQRIRGAWALYRHLRQYRPDVVHFFLPESYLIGSIVAIVAGIKTRVMSRRSLSNYQDRHPILAPFEMWLHRHTSVLLGNSQRVVDQLLRECDNRAKVGLIHNGIEIPPAIADDARSQARRHLGIRTDTFVLAIIANLVGYKGHADLLQALALANNRLPSDWYLLVVGRDDGSGAALMKQASETGIADHILWLGEHRDVDRYLRATDIAVLCSHEEGFSNSLIEAMAFGIPVIATAVGGNLDAVVPEESGLLVPSRAPTELAAAILHMATKPEFRALCGASARRRVQENFSLAACTQRYANLYRGIELVAQDGVQAVIDPHHYGIRREAVAAARGLRIVHVIPDLGIGGAERMLAQLAISADYVNVQEIVIVTLLPGGFYVDQIRDAGIQVVVLDCSSLLGLITSLIKLVRLISRLQPNIVQGWMYYGDFAALLALSLSRARKNAQLLWTIRCSGMEFDLYRRRLRATVWACRRLSSWPNLVVANSAAGLEAHRHMGYHPRRTQVIANGIDTERFQPDKATRREVRNELGIPDDAILLIHVARVDPMKDHQTLLAAMAKLPDIHALVVGFGTERLLVTPNVQCLGVRTDLPRLYPAADFVVSSSAFGEGFSNVIGEGMASGLPAIATDVGDARIIIGETGVVVPPRDADALALAVRSLASERPRERILRSTRARARVVEKFSLANAIAQFDELYSRVASRQPSDRHERT